MSDIQKPKGEGYALPRSSEKGVPFVDFNEVIKSMKKKGYIKSVKKRRTNERYFL